LNYSKIYKDEITLELTTLCTMTIHQIESFHNVSVCFRMFESKTFEVLKIKAFTFVNNCFQYENNAAIEHPGQTLNKQAFSFDINFKKNKKHFPRFNSLINLSLQNFIKKISTNT
jgi:hypothetical protein